MYPRTKSKNSFARWATSDSPDRDQEFFNVPGYASEPWFSLVLSWLVVFAMTWIVLWNSAVLPLDLLWIAVPWSLFEIFVAALISKKMQSRSATN